MPGPGLRARALAVAAHLAHFRSDLAAVVALGAEGRAARTVGARRARADALLWLARARDRLGTKEGPGRPAGEGSGAPEGLGASPAESRALLEESLALWREVGEPWGEAQALEWIGAVTRDAGDLRGSRPSYAAALAQRRALGDRRGIAQTLGSLANLAVLQGEYAAAIACAEESLSTARALGDRARVASALSTLSLVAQAMGDAALAHRYLELQLAAAQQADAAPMVVLAAYRLAVLAAARRGGSGRQAVPAGPAPLACSGTSPRARSAASLGWRPSPWPVACRSRRRAYWAPPRPAGQV